MSGTVERAVLRMGAWELMNTDIPVPVVINEAVDLAKKYGDDRSYAFINSVLSKIARKLEKED